MIPALLLLLASQLAGETLARLTGLPLPGPVIGMILLLCAFGLRPKLAETARPLASGILGNLSLLFVPAGVGVVGHLDKMAAHGLALLAALTLSTLAAIAAGALTFSLVARLLKTEAAE
ncbi:CidA/LrgA family protein [Neomegalonema sp.]|uniref:CidA/LrgA family protein n=1 Tax=Neomegalonema sp. TaxID=2039713 RepID=UPI0026264E6F|nr:CidA/LrgA family protein [Neomegalonema sp.]MDD2869403.1 CidA/LrgA family protein [Neomegalonema sp.]